MERGEGVREGETGMGRRREGGGDGGGTEEGGRGGQWVFFKLDLFLVCT